MNDTEKLESLTKLIYSFDESIKLAIETQGQTDYTKGMAFIISLLKQHV